MALDASALLGSPQLAGTRVAKAGTATVTAIALDIGNLPQTSAPGPQAQTPDFGRAALLSVTAAELALISIQATGWNGRIGTVLARVPRTEVASATLGQGVAEALTIRFTNGNTWLLEVGLAYRRSARKLVDLLSSTAEGSRR